MVAWCVQQRDSCLLARGLADRKHGASQRQRPAGPPARNCESCVECSQLAAVQPAAAQQRSSQQRSSLTYPSTYPTRRAHILAGRAHIPAGRAHIPAGRAHNTPAHISASCRRVWWGPRRGAVGLDAGLLEHAQRPAQDAVVSAPRAIQDARLIHGDEPVTCVGSTKPSSLVMNRSPDNLKLATVMTVGLNHCTCYE
jgi:hypothetical protein